MTHSARKAVNNSPSFLNAGDRMRRHTATCNRRCQPRNHCIRFGKSGNELCMSFDAAMRGEGGRREQWI